MKNTEGTDSRKERLTAVWNNDVTQNNRTTGLK